VPWDGELDLARKVWTVPPERMKREREHRVPLTASAIAIIDYMREVRQNSFVFPGDQADEFLSDMALRETIRRMNEARVKAGKPLWVDPKQGNREVVPHGFRSSFRNWVDEDTAFTDWKLDTTARYTHVATNVLRTVMSPLDRLTLPKEEPPA
jgi:integrase